tara:strand:+ start:497 stop:757 length:261 start_codon:yes stop_codon:yes gene_type:complete
MNKKEILKQLENIKSLMLSDIFYIDEDLVSSCLECNGIGTNSIDEICKDCDGSGIEEEYKDNLLNNDTMYIALSKAIEIIENKGIK